jgi:hypothetical protein
MYILLGSFFIAGLVYSLIFMLSLKSKVLSHYDKLVCNDPLTQFEIYKTWIICIFSPVLGGAILYNGWKHKLPFKAKQANKISILAFIAVLIATFFYAMITR